jgi:hypothetical protein
MDLTNHKACIISCGVGGWYAAGVERLHRSLVYNGYAGAMLLYKDAYPPDCPPHSGNPYAFKIYAFLEAIKLGYRQIMWLDSSFWCVKTPHHIFDDIIDNGVVGFSSGYNLAQTAPDNLLKRMGWSRDYAETLPEIATGMVGLNLDNPNGKAVFDLWSKLCDEGYFKNSRFHNGDDSLDPRFLHGRQDQSAYSCAIHELGIKIDVKDYVAYYQTRHNPEKLTFWIGGL